jgi:imidazolonepropionase-like amidohydrolase
VPKGRIALTNARIITMNGDQVIESGTILIEGNKIEKVGNSSDIKVPGDAFVVDCGGKTIMPGMVDVHAHMGQSWNGISPQQQWSYVANVAYGVTTTHDPSADSEMIFSQSEMQKAGLMVAPRIYSTGTILYGADGDFKAVINSLDDARAHLRRMKAMGAFSVKSYNQPRREQRQQVIQAARELEMMVYPEGGSFFYHNMSMILDGHTGVEHSIPVSPVYKDVTTLWGRSKTGYTPTLIVGYGGIWGENYWYHKTEVWKNERLLKYYPRTLLDSRSMRRTMAGDDDYGHIGNAKACKKIMDAGTKVQLGAHGQLHGLGAHWELWMLAQGGFSNMEAIRAATQWGADYIGMGDQIGSIQEGKLADLIVMDKNPLEDIRNSETIHRVILNGRIYDPETMDEVGNHPHKRAAFWWEGSKGADHFEWHEETNSFMDTHCGCFH